MIKEYNISLRERKSAQTKIDLARAAEERLQTKRLKDISVKELCETIPISEVTFYNYFPKKNDLIVYLFQLWHLKSAWYLKQWEKEKSNLEIIEAYFEHHVQELEECPNIINEAMAFFVQKRGDIEFKEMSIAEKLLAYPELPEIEDLKIPNCLQKKDLLEPYIRKAIEQGELPKETGPEGLISMLQTILVGGLMALRHRAPKEVSMVYRNMLKILWHGLRSGILEDSSVMQPVFDSILCQTN